MKYQLVISTIPTRREGAQIALKLVGAKLVACVNMIPGVRSFFRWKDNVEESDEIILFMKTTEDKVGEVIDTIKKMHSYEVPEAISIELKEGSEDYLKWIEESVG